MDTYRSILTGLIRTRAPEAPVELSAPPDPAMGDLALACFPLAKALRKNPAQVAAELAKTIEKPPFVERIETKGPYLNFFFDRARLAADTLAEVRAKGDAFGSSAIGAGKRALIEHTSINPNASPHVGRARNAFIGDVLVRLHRFEGYEVEVQYLVNDAGKQIALLVLGAEGRDDVGFDDLLNIYIDINRRLEADPSIEARVFDLLKRFEAGEEETKRRFRRVVETCVRGQAALFAELGIHYDVFRYESDYLWNHRTEEVLDELRRTGKVFEDEQGRIVLDQEGLGLPIKSPVLVLARSDGTSLYVLRDLAYTIDKVRAAPERNIVVLGEDQKTYFLQLKAALELMGYRAPEAVHYSFVLLSDGKMSTRKGTVVLLSDFMREAVARAREAIAKRRETAAEDTADAPASAPPADGQTAEALEARAKAIAYGAVKYAILKVANNRNVTFDWESALAFEGDTGPYLQYSHARICSIFRKYGRPLPHEVNGALLTHPAETDLIKALGEFPAVVRQAADQLSPHILANYACGLTKCFSTFYHECPVLNAESEALRDARLALIAAVRQVVHNSLRLLGIEPIERM